MLQAGKGQAVLKALAANDIQAKDQDGMGYVGSTAGHEPSNSAASWKA